MALLREYKEIAYQWGIWKTEESPEELLALLPDPERYEQQLTRFSSPHRKLEWLSVRVLLYQLLGMRSGFFHSSGKNIFCGLRIRSRICVLNIGVVTAAPLNRPKLNKP